MPHAVDLTKNNDVVEFSGSSEDDVNYAKTFWQSVQLEPPVESRLVSSDIKQRLKVAPQGSHNLSFAHRVPEEQQDYLKDFFMKARTLEQLDSFKRVQKFARAREEDRLLLEKRRQERLEKEEISRNKGMRRPVVKEAFMKPDPYDDGVLEEDPNEALQQLDLFEKEKFGEDEDSD